MSETIRAYPKNSPERLAIAMQLKRARQLDRPGGYVIDREMTGYLDHLNGLRGTFAYLREHSDSNTVLDIGAGSTKGIAQLAESNIGEGLDFQAVVLSGSSSKLHLPMEQVIRTSAEVLHGVPDNSVAGVISNYGLIYSAVPELVAERMDQVLVKGGIIKANFHNPQATPLSWVEWFQTHDQFTGRLQKLGYDVHVQEYILGCDIVTAKKPGGPFTISASELARLDERYSGYIYSDQINIY